MYPFKSKKPVTANHQLLDYPKVSIQLNKRKQTDIALSGQDLFNAFLYLNTRYEFGNSFCWEFFKFSKNKY